MQETLDLRVNARHARRVFAEGEGVALSPDIRKVVLATSDPPIASIRAAQAELNAQGESLFYGWHYRGATRVPNFARRRCSR